VKKEKIKKIEELCKLLRRLENRDYSERTLGEKEKPFVIKGAFNRVDLSKTSGWVRVEGMAIIVDASEAHDLHLELVGKFNLVDLSGGKKIELNREKAEINLLDASGVSIQKLIS